MSTVLITGANRGIGLEHARQYAESGDRVIACARRPDQSSELQALADQYPDAFLMVALDVTDPGGIEHLLSALGDEAVDVLINNAGTFGPQGAPAGMAYQSLTNMDYAIWRQILEVNLLGAFRVAVALEPRLRQAERPLLVNMTSDLGSIANNHNGHSYAYRSSKAGLNMISRGMAAEWPGIIVVAMAPGWCKTELGGEAATLETADSVREQQQTFRKLTLDDSGRCIDRFGAEVDW